jgi:thiosulfate/3-mercaptopyruvate sulfurtransferase
MRLIETNEIHDRLADPKLKIIDSRAAERYRGEIEPIDPVAGHIPGALLSPHLNVLDSEGKFLSADELYQHFKSLLGDVPAEEAAFYCGSGVTAVQNVLAMKYAGMGDARLYAGSWSEWITDTGRPISTGDSP